MPGSRRNFLKNVSLSVLGSAGFLLPNKATASIYRRRGRACCPGAVPVAPIACGPRRSYGNVNSCYPTPTGPVQAVPVFVTATGNWFSWGTKLASVTGLSFQVTDGNGGPLGIADPKPDGLPNDATNWAYLYANFPPVNPDQPFTFYLTVTYNGAVRERWGPYLTANAY